MKTKIKNAITLLCVAILTGISLMIMFGAVASAGDSYESRTPELQVAYDATRLAHCISHKSLALSKIEDEIKGGDKLSNEKRNQLHKAANQDCEGKQ